MVRRSWMSLKIDNEKKLDVTANLMEIEAELQEIIKQNKERITELQQEIETAEENERQAKKAMLDAKKGDDPKAYAKAVANHRTASDIVEFYSGKLGKLKAEPLITSDEYKEYTRRIKSELERINNEKRAKARDLLKELFALEPELSININKG